MTYRLVALVTYNWDDTEETFFELYFHSQENAEQWVKDNRDDYQSFHYAIIKEFDIAMHDYYEDDDWEEEEEE